MNSFPGEQFEVVRHIVEHPEGHERDINAIFEEGMTYRNLQEEFDVSTPRERGFPADTWKLRNGSTDCEPEPNWTAGNDGACTDRT